MSRRKVQPQWYKKLRNTYSAYARRRRAALFHRSFPDVTSLSVLDLGGGDGSHIAQVLPGHPNVTVADISPDALATATRKYGFKTRVLDGDDLSQFGDNEFDLVFSNSVIEHVTGPKNEVRSLRSTQAFTERATRCQQRFADGVRRIGRSYFVQTPYRYFFVETHTASPGPLMLLPREAQLSFWKAWPFAESTPDFHLLTSTEMRLFFPDARILTERELGVAKSLIAVRRPA